MNDLIAALMRETMPAARIMPEGLLTPETIVVSHESEFLFDNL